MLTKKHFLLFADYIKTSGESEEARRANARMIIAVSKRVNPLFDSSRFITACNLPLPIIPSEDR